MRKSNRRGLLATLILVTAVSVLACNGDDNGPSCIAVLSGTSAALPPAGGSDTVAVTTGNGCTWWAFSSASWLTLTSGPSYTGSGTVTFTATASGTSPRTATLTVAGQAVVVSQGAQPTYTLSGRVTDVFIGAGPRDDLGIPDAMVTATGPVDAATTTASRGTQGKKEGDYSLGGLLAGTYAVTFVKAGYTTATVNLSLSGDATHDVGLTFIVPSPPTTSNLTGYWSGTGSWFNAPFKLQLIQNGNTLSGRYADQHDDTPSVSGQYSPSSFELLIYLGDTGFTLECTIVDARRIDGAHRYQGLRYPFTMTR